MTATRCRWVPGELSIITTVNAAGLCDYTGETLEQTRLRYPAAVEGLLDEACAALEAAAISKPTPCSKDDWWYALEALPPKNWHQVRGAEVFQMTEHFSGRVTGTYCRIGTRYWHWYDIAGTPAAELVAKAAQAAG